VLHDARKSTRDRDVVFASDRERYGREPKPRARRDRIAPARARPAESLPSWHWTDPPKGLDCRPDWVGGRSPAPCDRLFATVRGVNGVDTKPPLRNSTRRSNSLDLPEIVISIAS